MCKKSKALWSIRFVNHLEKTNLQATLCEKATCSLCSLCEKQLAFFYVNETWLWRNKDCLLFTRGTRLIIISTLASNTNESKPAWHCNCPRPFDNMLEMFCGLLEEPISLYAYSNEKLGLFLLIWEKTIFNEDKTFPPSFLSLNILLSGREKMLNWFRTGDIFIGKETLLPIF